MQKEFESLEFLRGVKFEFIDSIKSNGTRTIYIQHNFFHQSKLGRDVALQNTHNVLFKSPRDLM